MIVITQQSCYGEVKQTIATTVERARRLAASKWRVSDYPLITYQGFIERSQCGAPLGDGAFHPRSPGRFNSCSLDPSENASVSANAEHGIVIDPELPESMPCPRCGGQWDCVMVIGGIDTVICGDCNAEIPEAEYRKDNASVCHERSELVARNGCNEEDLP